MFMGSEFGQFIEWDYKKELDWFLLDYERHNQMHKYIKELNAFYKGCPALYEMDDSWDGFMWLNVDEAQKSALCFMRRSAGGAEQSSVCAFNFTPVPIDHFVIGLPKDGELKLVFSSDKKRFGGEERAKMLVAASKDGFAGHPCSAVLSLPPLSAVFYEFNDIPVKRGKDT
jgi:1,4-alpha-glucan branching enzyme